MYVVDFLLFLITKDLNFSYLTTFGLPGLNFWSSQGRFWPWILHKVEHRIVLGLFNYLQFLYNTPQKKMKSQPCRKYFHCCVWLPESTCLTKNLHYSAAVVPAFPTLHIGCTWSKCRHLYHWNQQKVRGYFKLKIFFHGCWSSPLQKIVWSDGNSFSFWSNLENTKFATFSPIRGSSELGKTIESWHMKACYIHFQAGIK